MADNSTLPATGDVIADEDISGVKYQRMKLIDATVGSTTPVGTTANPLKVAEIEADCTTVLSTTINSIGSSSSIDTTGYGAIVCQVSGVWQGSFFFEASNDGTVWDTVLAFSRDNLSLQDVITSGGLFTIRPSGKYIRLNVTNITGSMTVLAIGRKAEGIAASDLLSLAMDKQNNTPLQVQLNGMKADQSGALIPSDGVIVDYRSIPATVPAGPLYIIDTAGYNSIYISASVSMSLTVTGYSSNELSGGAGNPLSVNWVAAPGTYFANGSTLFTGQTSGATTGTGFNQNSGNITHMWFPVTGRYFRLQVLSGGGPGTLITCLRTALAPDATPKLVNINLVTGSTGNTLNGIGSVPVSGQIKTALLAARTDGSNYWPTMTDEAALVVRKNAVPQLGWNYAAAASGLVNTTVAVTAKAAVAGQRGNISSLQIQTEALGAATEFVIRDGAAGTVMFRTKLGTAALPLMTVTFDPPLRQAAVNTLIEFATLTASVSGGVFVNMQGFMSN